MISIISIMALYESRRQSSIEVKINNEKKRVEEIITKQESLEKEHKAAKRQIEVLQSRNTELENSLNKPDDKGEY
jgi:hypothetical protein